MKDASGAHTHASHAMNEHGESAVGKAGDPAKVTRTVTIDMNDSMRFSPAVIAVKQGEVLRFVVKNSGKLKHELVIGSAGELKEHAQMMAKFPEMEHAEPNQVTLAPGTTGTMIWQFDTAGTVDFACLQPGHFEAGMKGQVQVAKR
nr:cupredoxin family protein [Pseudoduganella aquatica]